MTNTFLKLLTSDDGASLVEYALLIALVAGAATFGLHMLGGTLNSTGSLAAGMIQNGNVGLQ